MSIENQLFHTYVTLSTSKRQSKKVKTLDFLESMYACLGHRNTIIRQDSAIQNYSCIFLRFSIKCYVSSQKYLYKTFVHFCLYLEKLSI